MSAADDICILTTIRDMQGSDGKEGHWYILGEPQRAVLTRIIDALDPTKTGGAASQLLVWANEMERNACSNSAAWLRAGALALQRKSRETELRAALKEFAWHRGSCEASMMTPVDYDNLESEEYYVSGPCTCGYDDFAKKHPDAQSFIYDERNNRKTTYTCHPWSEERQKATDAQRAARAPLGDENGIN